MRYAVKKLIITTAIIQINIAKEVKSDIVLDSILYIMLLDIPTLTMPILPFSIGVFIS